MTRCKHQTLVLLTQHGQKIRCRHCHLTINEGEVGDGYCPECYEVAGVRRSDFERIEAEVDEKIRYSCEQCGAIIES